MDWEKDGGRASLKKAWRVQVHAASHLDPWILDYSEGLRMNHQEDGTSTLGGELPDLSAVYGLILQLRDAGILIYSLQIEILE
ncbi:MAG: hypothetical protein D5R97_03455 [Candidatus Syntrophonatronum acetioxidans]|uniref:Uncharacterized protein n=1 Tax=Candidatus Syntrophonatronum acetioxidans TaxID=1795816 RepID=A0A424YG48_9FIRM|nr:MAG: hypothetical protein D5R97_03455 [Candidatus Syntrophonatronum acetioxidans]